MTGGRTALCCSIVGLATAGVIAPAAQGVEDSVGDGAVVVLELTGNDGAPTDLAAPLADPRSGVAVTTPELKVPPFSVAALTWAGLESPDEEIAVRVHSGGEWTAWATLEADGSDVGDIGGTEPYVVGEATGVQVRLAGGDGVLPAGVELHLIPADPGDDEHVASTADGVAELVEQARTPATTSAARPATPDVAAPERARAPRVISRAGWGASPSLMRWTPSYDNLDAAVVHHTAGTNSYTAAQSAGIVRGIYRYHAVSRDWGDIGYNFLVDKYGQVFEGRAGTLAAPDGLIPEAAHARGFNRGTLGISVLGDYSSVYAPDSVLDTMAEVIAWKFEAGGVDMRTSSGMISPGTASRPRGQRLPRVFAHRDVGDTTCPGHNIYRRMSALNADVAARMAGSVTRDTYHLSNRLAGGPAELAFRLGLSTDDVLVGDWDGDGKDTLAVRRGNTYLVYDRSPGVRARVVRYGRADDVVLAGDWNNDGKDTLAVRRGREYHVKNSMTSGNADRVIRYGRAADEVLVGDWDGDGRDTLAVRRGEVYHVKNTVAGGDADVVLHYGRADDVVLVGDWDGDRADTFAVRRGDGYHVRNVLSGGDADVVFHYGRPRDAVLVGDWDGDRRDTLGVRRPR